MRSLTQLNSLIQAHSFDIVLYESPNLHFTSCEVLNVSAEANEGVKIKSDSVLMVFLRNHIDYIEFAFDSYEERNGGIAFYNKNSKLFLNYRR